MKRLGLILCLLLFSTVVHAANRFAVCSTTCTWDNSSTAMWSTTSGGGTGASAPGSSDAVIFDSATCVGGTTCTTTVNANLTIQKLAFATCTASTTGCILDFSVNNNSVTFGNQTPALDVNGTGTRTLRMGTNNWTFINSSGFAIDGQTNSNFTLTPSTSTLVMNLANSGGTTVTFRTGNNTWGNLLINGNSAISDFVISTGNPTFASIIVNGPNYIDWSGSGTTTVTGALTFTGTSSNAVSIFGATFTKSSGVATGNYVWLRSIQCNGAATYSFANSYNGGFSIAACHIAGPVTGGGGCILGGWLLWRDMPGRLNDNYPAWLEKAA